MLPQSDKPGKPGMVPLSPFPAAKSSPSPSPSSSSSSALAASLSPLSAAPEISGAADDAGYRDGEQRCYNCASYEEPSTCRLGVNGGTVEAEANCSRYSAKPEADEDENEDAGGEGGDMMGEEGDGGYGLQEEEAE